MSKALEPLSDYQILEKCAPSSKGLPGADQAVPELDADHMLEDDFEHVEMDDILLLEDDGTTASSLYTKKELAAVHENVRKMCAELDCNNTHLGVWRVRRYRFGSASASRQLRSRALREVPDFTFPCAAQLQASPIRLPCK